MHDKTPTKGSDGAVDDAEDPADPYAFGAPSPKKQTGASPREARAASRAATTAPAATADDYTAPAEPEPAPAPELAPATPAQSKAVSEALNAIFTERRVETVEFSELEAQLSGTVPTPVIRTVLETMSEANQLMLVDDQVILI